jgi:uncharacterized protein YciI
MFIVFLRFGQNRAQAGQWMAEHNKWLAEGFESGVFVMAGSLENAQGGVLIARDIEQRALLERVRQDPFVMHGVVAAEVHGFKPSRLADGLGAVLAPPALAGSSTARTHVLE